MPPITIIPLATSHTIDIPITGTRTATPETDAAWADLRRAHPNLFDGPILLVDPPIPINPQLRATRATYRHVAAASSTNIPARSLGVKGFVTARDRRDTPHVLLGLRGSSVRMYPGTWEIAPAGNVEPPPQHVDRLTLANLVATLQAEADEELGCTIPMSPAAAVAILDDPIASSVDIILHVPLAAPLESLRLPCAAHDDARREYAALQWIPTDALADWLAQPNTPIAPPTRELITCGALSKAMS